ncbi:hypothetical protein SDC9_08474 [bioreactor metagenome]|uniref:Big-1 domain-containing protein n=1 Tax=bioreactor metagenome TaxID=1076179 RepID=A0A644T7R1_9ZZZZ
MIIDNEGHGISNDGDAYIDNNVISGNGGDGVSNGENGTADIIDNEITDNGGNGVTNDGNATLIDNEITDNNGDGVVNNGDLNGSGNTIGQKPILTITTNLSNRTINITVKATDKMGNIIVGATIKIYVNGILIGTGTTNSEGIVQFTYTATIVGTQNILTTMDAFNITDTDNNEIIYSTANNTTTVNITTKANTRSTIIISNATSGKSTIIRGVLIDENGNTTANAPINLVIGGKSYNLVTGADGSWSLSYTPLKAGNFIAKVYYNGNSNYVASTSSLNYTVAQGTDAPKKTDIRLLKKKSSKVFRHGKRVVMKWYTYKNYGATGSKNITTKVIIKNLKYKLWKVYNKKLSYKYGNNKIKFKLNLKSGEKFKLKLKVYKPIKQK